jgi:hypothetical protein
MQLLREAGTDGLFNTADDGAIEVLRLPGVDGILGNADDEIRPLTNFQREIVIVPVETAGVPNPALRQITVTIRYQLPTGGMRTYQVGSYISQFR